MRCRTYVLDFPAVFDLDGGWGEGGGECSALRLKDAISLFGSESLIQARYESRRKVKRAKQEDWFGFVHLVLLRIFFVPAY